MPMYSAGMAAQLLGVSPDTVRRWADSGRLPTSRDDHGHRVVSGDALAAFARSRAGREDTGEVKGTTRRSHASRGDIKETRAGRGHGAAVPLSSARNRLHGIVTDVVKDGVMAQVEIQAGPFRVVSLMSREAADDLGLEVGVVATGVIKSTNVVVERAE